MEQITPEQAVTNAIITCRVEALRARARGTHTIADEWDGHASTIRDLQARLAAAEKRGLLPTGWVITAAEFRTNERDPMTVNGHAVNTWIKELGRDGSFAWRGPDPIKRGNGRTVVEAIRAAEIAAQEADCAEV